MQRRKFLVGVGSFAAAGAAAMGTGAFETMEAGRSVDVTVSADSNSFVELIADSDSRYAEETGDGQLELDFSGGSLDGGDIIGSVDDKGLNPNSTYEFSDVFTVGNIGGFGDLYFVIEASGFDATVSLTASGTGNLSEGKSVMAADYSDPNNLPKLFEPGSSTVDVTITTGDSTNPTAGGTLTVYAAPGADRSELSDAL